MDDSIPQTIHLIGMVVFTLSSIFGILVASHLPKSNLNKADVGFFSLCAALLSTIWPILIILLVICGVVYIIIQLMDKSAKWLAEIMMKLVDIFNTTEQKKEE